MSTATSARPVVRLRVPAVDETFRALGTDVRLIAAGFGAPAAVKAARAAILDYHQRLSRFIRESELSALNVDPRAVVPASALLRDAVRAGLSAAERSRGLVDPGLLDALCAAGYEESFEPAGKARLPSGRGHPASAHPAARWRQIHVDDEAGTITRPPGMRLDLGGSGKGHVADLVSAQFAGLPRWVVDCGGDIRVGGTRHVEIAHPLDDRPRTLLRITDGAVATSTIVKRAWVTDAGVSKHHLIDPSTGEPAWTGILSATALASTTLEAETLAKTALLLGPEGARAVLADQGGLTVRENGDIETIGPLPEVPR